MGLEQAIECRPTDSEQAGGCGDRAVALRESARDYVALGALTGGAQIKIGRFATAEFEIGALDHAPVGHDDGTLDAVLELANVSWPVVAGNCRRGGVAEAAKITSNLAIEPVEKEPRQ